MVSDSMGIEDSTYVVATSFYQGGIRENELMIIFQKSDVKCC